MPSNNENNRRIDNDKTRPYKRSSVKKVPQSSNSKQKTRRVSSNTRQVQNGQARQAGKTNSKSRNKKKIKKGKFSEKHPKVLLTIKILLILFLLLCVVGAGIIAGMFFGLFGDDFKIAKEELKIGIANSVIVDKNGEVIADLSGDEKRKIITLEEMADYLPKAYVAIEDERFYQHSGVDFKRTAGAILNTIFKGSSSYGGSTITQQLVKNITKEDEAEGLAGITRKVKEWAKAFQVERMISKNQILELYLNILFVGGEGNLHGVELGAKYYFNKSAKDLDLAECAFLAGINSSPNYYNPYNLCFDGDTEEKRDNRIKSKALTVLKKMQELGYIESQEEYDAAVAKVEAGLTFQKGDTSSGSNYSYHTAAVLEQVINQIMEEKEVSRQLAENYVYSSGLKIYSTVEPTIQTRLEEEYKKSKYIITSPSKKQTSQSGMAIVDYKTGNVVGVAGGLGESATGGGWNRATQMKKQTGSSMKPISVIAPGLEEKVITAATVYDDAATNFDGVYEPKNYNRFMGLINIRSFIETSQNIPAVKIMKELTPEKSVEYLEKMGITSLDRENDKILSLALGGVTEGISPLEMAVAYGTIANGGVCVSPTFYSRVEDSSGNVVLTPNQTQTRAISEQNAYITTSIIEEPVKGASGTAKYCGIPGMETTAKTGTTDEDMDRWLCGYTPYYSAACWFGYNDSETVYFNGNNPAGQIWAAVMKDIHVGLANAEFTRPNGIVEQTVCKTTGCLATTGCTNTYKEIFTADNLPEKCEGHGSQIICTESNKIATQYCSQFTKTRVNTYGGTVPKEQLKLWTPLNGKSGSGTKIYETCNIHTKPKEQEKPKEEPKDNTVNTTNNTSIKPSNSVTNNNTSSNTNKTNTSTNNTSSDNKVTVNNTTDKNTTKED